MFRYQYHRLNTQIMCLQSMPLPETVNVKTKTMSLLQQGMEYITQTHKML